MDRRSFLQYVLSAAVLTSAQVEVVRTMLTTEPKPDKVATRGMVDQAAMHGLRWCEAVPSADDLPSDDPEGTARVTVDDDHIWTCVAQVGWVQLKLVSL